MSARASYMTRREVFVGAVMWQKLNRMALRYTADNTAYKLQLHLPFEILLSSVVMSYILGTLGNILLGSLGKTKHRPNMRCIRRV